MELNRQANEKALTYLKKLGEHYQQAHCVATQLGSSFGNQNDRDGLLRQLQDGLGAISAYEDEHIDERNSLLSAGVSKSAEVERELSFVRTLIERVLQAISAAESAAVAIRSQLAPQLDERTKARKVRAAYKATSKNQ